MAVPSYAQFQNKVASSSVHGTFTVAGSLQLQQSRSVAFKSSIQQALYVAVWQAFSAQLMYLLTLPEHEPLSHQTSCESPLWLTSLGSMRALGSPILKGGHCPFVEVSKRQLP